MKLKFGVPCSKLKDKIMDVEINCTSEEEAMAIAAGCILAGKKPFVYMQNSGLCRVLDIVLSLYKPYEIPLPERIISIRHSPYHHFFVGEITRTLLGIMQFWDGEEM